MALGATLCCLWPFSVALLCSGLWRNLACEGLSYDFAFLHDEGVSSQFVQVIGSFCVPQDVSVVGLDKLLFHSERGSGL